MRRALLAASALCALACATARAAEPTDNERVIRNCITAAAGGYRIPASILVVLLDIEGGVLSEVSSNTNGTVDIGPMQVNTIWVPDIAAHWSTDPARAYAALRDNFCANVEGGAWILRKGLDEAGGNFWEGVGFYHSHDPEHKAVYLRSVLTQVLRLQARASSAANAAMAASTSFAPRNR